jgi:hypothetical protein
MLCWLIDDEVITERLDTNLSNAHTECIYTFRAPIGHFEATGATLNRPTDNPAHPGGNGAASLDRTISTRT